jgi:hypothetical protein
MPVASLETTQALFWQQLAIDAARKRLRVRVRLGAHSGLFVDGSHAVGVHLIDRTRNRCVAVLVVMDDLTDHSDTEERRNCAGVPLIIGNRGRSAKCRGCDGHSSECTDETGREFEVHHKSPFELKGSTQDACSNVGANWAGPAQTGNNSAVLSDNRPHAAPWILYINPETRILQAMKHIRLLLCATVVATLTSPAFAAECFADYKAKQDNPLRLHYGVAQVTGPCTKDAARAQLAQRLGAQGWTLLNIVSVFGAGGLEQRKDSAGSNFLRF